MFARRFLVRDLGLVLVRPARERCSNAAILDVCQECDAAVEVHKEERIYQGALRRSRLGFAT